MLSQRQKRARAKIAARLQQINVPVELMQLPLVVLQQVREQLDDIVDTRLQDYVEENSQEPILISPVADNIWKIKGGTGEWIDITQEMITRYIGSALDYPGMNFAVCYERNGDIVLDQASKHKFPYSSDNFSPKNVTGFYSFIKQLYGGEITGMWIQLFDRTLEPQPFTLFDSIDSNCVIEIIQDFITLTPKYLGSDKGKQRTPTKAFNELKQMTKQGFTKQHADFVYSKLKISLHIINNAGTWYKNTKPARKLIEIFAHDNHASKYVRLDKITNVEYTHNLPNMHQPSRILAGYKRTQTGVDINVTARQYGSTMYKRYKPPTPYEQDSRFYYCTNDLSFTFKKWTLDNNLRPACQPYFDLLKSANHHLCTQQFEQLDDKQHHMSDIVKAFRSFKTSPYYERFKLPLGNWMMGKCIGSVLDIVSETGFSKITNVVYKNQTVKNIAWIQPNCIYDHIRLYYLLTNNLASFDIEFTITSPATELEFPFMSYDNPEAKYFNNAFIGKLIAGCNSSQVTYQSNDMLELQQIAYFESQQPEFISHAFVNDTVLTITKQPNKTQLYHIHAYIMSYVQVKLMTEMIACETANNKVIAYNTDGFFTHRKPNINYSPELGKFRHELKQVNFGSVYEPAVHDTVSSYENLPQITHQTYTLTIGPPGCGKSRQMFTNHHISSIICTPTHLLKSTHKQRNPDLNYSTYHKFFNINNTKHWKPTIYENVYIDECSMISREHLTIIENFAKYHRINIHLIGDIDEQGIHQLPPIKLDNVPSTPLKWSDFTDYSISRPVLPNRRQNQQDCEFLDSLRGLSYNQQLELIKTKLSRNIITKDQAVELYDETSAGVVSNHMRGNMLNLAIHSKKIKQLVDLGLNPNLVTVKVMAKKSIQGIVKGSISTVGSTESIYYNRTSSKQEQNHNKQYEIAYFTTCDAVQGGTISGKLIIDLVGASRTNLLYTAITRCTDLSNVYIITG